MKYIKTLKIDIDKKNFEVIPSVQYDSNTRFLHIQLLNDSVPFNITGCSVVLSGVKEDGNPIFNSCNIVNSEIGFIQAEVTEQMNAIPGYIDCEIKIYDGEGVLTSKKFTIKVTASQTSREVESTGEFKALTDALSKVNNINNKMDRGESISASQIDKNRGKFDQTYFTDEFLQQMAGNTPVNAVPSDESLTTEKYAKESITYEKVKSNTFIRTNGVGNLFKSSRNIDSPGRLKKQISNIEVELVNADNDFLVYGVSKKLIVKYSGAISSNLGSYFINEDIKSPLMSEIGVTFGNTVTAKLLIKGKAGFRICIAQHNATDGYISGQANYSRTLTSADEGKLVLLTVKTTINSPDTARLRLYLCNNTLTNGQSETVEISGWSIVKGDESDSPIATYENNQEINEFDTKVSNLNMLPNSQGDDLSFKNIRKLHSDSIVEIIDGDNEWKKAGYDKVIKASTRNLNASHRWLFAPLDYTMIDKYGLALGKGIEVGDTVYLRIKYRSNERFTLGLFAFAGDFEYKGAMTTTGPNIPNSNGELSEIVINTTITERLGATYVCPVIQVGDSVTDLASNNYIELIDFTMTKYKIKPDYIYKNKYDSAAPNIVAGSNDVIIKNDSNNNETYIEVNLPKISYTNKLPTGTKNRVPLFKDFKLGGKETFEHISSDEWLDNGVLTANKITYLVNEAVTGYYYPLIGIPTIKLAEKYNVIIGTDLNFGDKISARLKYKSDCNIILGIVGRSVTGAYTGAVILQHLTANNRITEATTSGVLNENSLNKYGTCAYISIDILTSNNIIEGQSFEVADFSLIAGDLVNNTEYKNADTDLDNINIVGGKGITVEQVNGNDYVISSTLDVSDLPSGGNSEFYNLIRDGEFRYTLPFSGNRLLTHWIIDNQGNGNIQQWRGNTKALGNETFEHGMKSAYGIKINSSSTGLNSSIYQDIPTYRIEVSNNRKISARVHYYSTKANSIRLKLEFIGRDGNEAHKKILEVLGTLNTSTNGVVSIDGAVVPEGTIYIRFSIIAAANNAESFIWNASVIASSISSEATNIYNNFTGLGLPRLYERLLLKREVTVIACGDSITEGGKGGDGTDCEGTSYQHYLCNYLKRMVQSIVPIRHIRNGNSGGMDIDVLLQSEDKIISREDGYEPDLIIMANGRNNAINAFDNKFDTENKGLGMWRLTCLEATIRRVRKRFPEVDIIIMMPCPYPPYPNDVKDEMFIRQHEILAQKYGLNVVYPEANLNKVMNNELFTDKECYHDLLHPSRAVGQHIIANTLIDYITDSVQNTKYVTKPNIDSINPISPLTKEFEVARRMKRNANFTRNTFTPIDDVTSGIIIDGVSELGGLYSERENDVIEFTAEFTNHVVVYPFTREENSGAVDVYVDDVKVGSVSCTKVGNKIWSGWVGSKMIFDVTKGSHKITIKNPTNTPTCIWWIGII